jgi:signal recognition particle subunit SRP54
VVDLLWKGDKMFDLISQGFKNAALKLKGQARLTDENISQALESIKISLLEADVDLQVTKEFLNNVREKALHEVVTLKSQSGKKVSAGDHFVSICHKELVEFLGGNQTEIIKNSHGPTVLLLIGLQGAGKTTHAAKLARLFTQERYKMRPLLVAADVYRPAAREQLKRLGEKIQVPVFSLDDCQDPVEIAKQALHYARQDHTLHDLVIIDTAGRLSIDHQLMEELVSLKAAVQPHNILLVIDSMIGQDAVRTANAFHSQLSLTGVILTKLDGDTRGGAALSIKKVTGQSILFAGTGEAVDKLEEFRPEGMAGRILGMGDIVGLMDDFSKVVSAESAEKSAQKMMAGHFDFNDFLDMMGTIGKMGPIQDVLAKTPLAAQVPAQSLNKINDKEIQRKAAIVQSMTKQERQKPELLLIVKSQSARSRITRIAQGSAHSEKAVKDFIEQFFQMQQMVKMMGGLGFGNEGFLSKIPGLGQLQQMAKMAKMMAGGGKGMGNLFGGGASSLFDENSKQSSSPGLSLAHLAEINRLKKRKKEEKQRKQKRR